MLEFLQKLFDSDFMPHGHCYFWRPEIVWLHVSSDALIALAYFFIPFTLVHIVRQRKDLVFRWMFVLFGVFVLACGATHVMSIWTLWHGTYRLEGVIKLVTALASVPTGILLMRMVPEIRALPSPAQLREANLALAAEVKERKSAELEVRELNLSLEERVRERTLQLERSNEELRRSNEALMRSNSDLKQFAYSASHDLQEPLRTVAIYGELLQEKYSSELNASGQKSLRHVVDATQRMRELLQNLLSYAQVAGSSEVATSSVNCNKAMDKVLFALQISILQTGATITYGDLPNVQAAEIHVLQLLQNLIGNSIKYSGHQAPVVNVSATLEDANWLFCVKDNGIGIEPEYAIKIFGLFKRLHGSRNSGTGVGLALCSRIVDRYSGRIWVESKKGFGASFFFTLPAAPIAPPSVAESDRGN